MIFFFFCFFHFVRIRERPLAREHGWRPQTKKRNGGAFTSVPYLRILLVRTEVTYFHLVQRKKVFTLWE